MVRRWVIQFEAKQLGLNSMGIPLTPEHQPIRQVKVYARYVRAISHQNQTLRRCDQPCAAKKASALVETPEASGSGTYKTGMSSIALMIRRWAE